MKNKISFIFFVLVFFANIAHAMTNNGIFVATFSSYIVDNKINHVALIVTNESKTNTTKNMQSKQTRKPLSTGGTGELSFFFLVGIFVNLAMISAYFIWAIRQWKKK